MKVDLVYTWVTGDDEKFINEWREHAENPEDVNPERFRDIYELLKYSLRSVEMYLPWFNKLYLVTKRPQIPKWINTTHPKIEIVHHDQIIDKDVLPTFNPNVIESYLHKIPGLSEHFLYINDDFLFGSPTHLDDFMPNGKHRIFNSLIGENLGWRIYDGKNDIIGLGIIEHTPLFIKKEFWQNMTDLFPEKRLSTKYNRFRKSSDLMTYKLYRYYMLKYRASVCQAIPLWELKKINYFHKITNNFNVQKRGIKKIESQRPKFYCLNDDQRDNPNPRVVDLVKDFLIRNYPEKSVFES